MKNNGLNVQVRSDKDGPFAQGESKWRRMVGAR